MSGKLTAGAVMPAFTLPRAGGGEVGLGGARPGWQLVVVYRGRHCPICKTYLTGLGALRGAFAEIGTEIVAISGDPRDKAEADVAEFGFGFDIGYGMNPDQMRALGLYISDPRSPEETDRPFPEPGVFVVNPAGKVHIVDISNAPFSRPDLANLRDGIAFIQRKGYPIRGTAT